MNLIFAPVLLLVMTVPTYAQNDTMGLDTPGLINTLSVETDGREFDVRATSNFEITNHEFEKNEKRLTLFISSGVEDNLSELVIPADFIGGNFTFYLNGEEIFPRFHAGEEITFVTVKFDGKGMHKLDIIGTTYLPEFAQIAMLVLAVSMFGLVFLKGRKLDLFVK